LRKAACILAIAAAGGDWAANDPQAVPPGKTPPAAPPFGRGAANRKFKTQNSRWLD
jgi:hypothetical protein